MTTDKPLISVVLAIYNEGKNIRQAVVSLLRQRTDIIDFEILLLDGNSTDNTRETIEALIRETGTTKVRYILNHKRITPAAFNLGIDAAKGQYIAIMGAHCEYQDNYLEQCVLGLNEHDAVGCSGMVYSKSLNDGPESELIIRVLSSSFGVSSSSFRTIKSGYASTIPYGVFRREVFGEVGYYDEKLLRNQDNDMNSRIVKAGYKLYLTDKTFCHYFPSSTVKGLFRYARTNGFWNARTLMYGSHSLRIIHFVPFVFFLFICAGVGLSVLYPFIRTGPVRVLLFLFVITLAFYFLLGGYFAIKAGFKRKQGILLFPFTVFGFHFLYGYGTLLGLFNPIKK